MDVALVTSKASRLQQCTAGLAGEAASGALAVAACGRWAPAELWGNFKK